MSALDSWIRKHSDSEVVRSNAQEGMKGIYKKYLRKKHETIADLAVVATGLSVDLIRNQENELALEALNMTNPDFDPAMLNEYSDQELEGIVNSSKGKYFELLVIEELNAGGSVGGITLPAGYEAQIADSMTQAGWDVKIVDQNGALVEYLQLKSTDSLAYVQDALDKYPDIRILSTEEIESPNELVISSDIENDKLEREMLQTLESEGDTFLDNVLESFNPLLPLCFILTTQGYKVATSQVTYLKAISEGKDRAKRALAASSFGALSYALGAGWFSLPVAIGAGAVYDARKNFTELNNSFSRAIPFMQIFNQYRKTKP